MEITGDGSILLPSAWTISRQNVDPDVGANLAVVAVSAVVGDLNSFDLTFQWEQTPNCSYLATVAATVTDRAGNAIDTDHRTASWAGFAPSLPEGRAFSYWRLLPSVDREMDATQDLRRVANIVQELLDLYLYDIDHWIDHFDPDLCADDDLDGMLHDLGNPFAWSELLLTENQRRRLVRDLVAVYKLKGTAIGIEGVCRALLGVEVRVVDYISDTWCLGFAALGTGGIAEVESFRAGPFDLSAGTWPKTLRVKIDGGTTQTLTLALSSVSDPDAVTTAELVAALDPQLVGGGLRTLANGSPANGSPALVLMSEAQFDVSPGDNLLLEVNGVEHELVFVAGDIAIPGAATAAECAAALRERIPGVEVEGGDIFVWIYTLLRGPEASLKCTGGSAQTPLGIYGVAVYGADGLNLAVHSSTIGTASGVELVVEYTPDDLATVLCFPQHPVAGAGACVLGPGASYGLYCFDIETQGVLPSETVTLIRKIGRYMKAAHEHLINIRPAPTAEFSDGWVLGVTALGDGSTLFE